MFFTREKNDMTNRKPQQRCVSFAPQFLAACSAIALQTFDVKICDGGDTFSPRKVKNNSEIGVE